MSARIYISDAIAIIPQADFQATREGDNGSWTATQSFWITKGSISSGPVRSYFATNRPLSQVDPNCDQVFDFLKLRKISPQTITGGWQVITAEFGGVPDTDANGNPIDDDSEFQVTYSMRGQTSDFPLSMHPKFKELAQIEKASLGSLMAGEYGWGPDPFDDSESPVSRLYYRQPLLSDDGSVTVVSVPEQQQLTTDRAKLFADRIAAGITTYRAGGYTYSKRWASKERLTRERLAALGKIITPPGNPPTPSDDRDWLLTYAAFEQSGEENANPAYINELTFELSEEGKWDVFLQSDLDEDPP